MHLRFGILVAVAVAGFGCATVSAPGGKGTELLHSMVPANQPSVVGSYDFELLGPVEGSGCASWGDSTTYWTSVPGTDLGKNGADLENQAEAAAMFDAISKLKDADTIVPLRLKSDGSSDKVCVTVYGRGIRYTHGPPVAAAAPAVPLVAPAAPAGGGVQLH